MSGYRDSIVWSGLLSALLLAGCGSSPVSRAPVEDRAVAPRPAVIQSGTGSSASVATQAPVPKPAIVNENAGKPGYYTVKPGDTLMRISLDNGQNYKDISKWNNLENPNKIEVGQVLRVLPPSPEGVAITRPVSSGSVVAATLPTATLPAKAASAPVAPASTPATGTSAGAQAAEDDLPWIWPSAGTVLAPFDESKNNGIDIAGAAGDPVVAAADGRVIWAGLGEGSMRNYGNLIIIQHNKTYITAYANNQTLLVKEDQRVKRGQKIAEMGSTGTDRVKLHFELRRLGKAQDPAKYLPPR